MKLAHVRAFVSVIETGSIHAAARQLGISHPALSKAVRALEQELAAPLLMRSSRGTVATTYGQVFYERARLIVIELRKAIDDVGQLRDRNEGSLNIGIAPASTAQLAPIALAAFRREYPDAVVTIREGLPPTVMEHLRDGTLDLAISPFGPDVPRHEFTLERLMAVEMSVVARPEHPLAGARSLKVLADPDWLRTGAAGGRSLILDRYFSEHGLPPPRQCVESHSLVGSLMLLQNGDYLGMLPTSLLSDSLVGLRLVRVPVVEPIAANNIALIYAADRPLTRVAQLFATHLRRVAGQLVHGERQPKGA